MSVHSILDVAIKVLLADPSASLGDVAKAAGVSRTTLHKRYATRHDLLVALAHDAYDRVDKAMTDAQLDVPGEDVVAGLERAITALIPLGPRIEFMYRQIGLDDVPDLVTRYEQSGEHLLRLIQRGQEAGKLRADLPDWWILATLEGSFYTAWEAISFGRLAPLDAPKLVMTTVMRGIGT
ncbi:TetR/AcrR family transcriptional regulator [Kibdelosporangium persicum]|uniref:TetR/AcrR family transcriptional regulator, repressor for lfrA n=1 Tax=Kibdelosporangium persicum TaxID=2698649 RepID=A0ABX2EWB0_9PSEU|nr:TetR/AcrR family transcriptional regulator [Kibdelosporangium persicum]NRN63095.1 TetR/AcrR family transcriptional regulator, repressor for lfrA [Kibdelosporangium persicum]